jgi:hypothetical protein
VHDLVRMEDDQWDAALADSGHAYRFSHTARAGRALESAFPSYTWTPYRADFDDGTSALFPLVTVKRKLGPLSILLGMPLGLEGTPIPLAGRLEPPHLEALFRELNAHGALHVYGGAGGSPPALGEVMPAETHVLDLREGFEALWNGSFTAKNRNMCRKADKAGIVVADETATGGEDYYTLYETIARGWERDALPKDLFTALLGSGSAELWMARLDGRPAAGALLLRGSGDLLYWSGAMDREFGSLAPSNAVLRTAIQSACERGIEYLDFGASAGLAGVESFKRSFGASAREYIGIELTSRRHRGLQRARRALKR